MTRTRSAQWMRRHVAVLLLAGIGIFLLAGVAVAFWSIGVTSPQGSAKGAQLTPPSSPSASVNANGSVTVVWTHPGGELAGATYSVTRTGGPEGPTSICANAAGATCTDNGPLTPADVYTYSIVATLGTNWVSTAATATATAETPSLKIALSAGPYTAGTPITVSSITAQVAGVTDVTYGASSGTTKTINWSGLAASPSGHAASYPSSVVVFTNGVATPSSTFTAYDAGSNTLTATDASVTGVTGSVSVTVSSTGTATQFSLSAATTTPTAGATDNLTITAQDTYGNTEPSYTGSKSLTFSGASAIGSHNPTVTNASASAVNFGTAEPITFASGVASPSTSGATNQAIMTLYKAGAASIVVTQGSISNGTGLPVTVSSTGTATQFSLSAATTTPTAGATDNLTITAQDTYGNTEPSYTGSKSLTFSGASAIGSHNPTVTNASASAVNFGTAEPITFASGVASPSTSGATNQAIMTLYKAGAASIVVTQGSISNGTGLPVTVSSTGTATQFSLSAATTTPTAGATDNLTITAQDTYGNTEPSYTGSKSLTFSGASAIGSHNPTVTNASASAVNFGTAEPITFASGVASPSTSGATNQAIMTLYKAGAASIVVTQGSISNGTGLPVTVSSTGTATQFSLSAATTTPTAGATDNLTITAQDTYGNTEPSYTGSKSLTFSGASAIGSHNPTVTNASASAVNFGTAEPITFASGVASPSTSGATNQAIMTLYKAGAASIVVTQGSISNGTGLPVTVSSTGTATQFSLSAATTTPTAGATDNLTITAQDTYGNTEPSYTGDKTTIKFTGANPINGNNPTVHEQVRRRRGRLRDQRDDHLRQRGGQPDHHRGDGAGRDDALQGRVGEHRRDRRLDLQRHRPAGDGVLDGHGDAVLAQRRHHHADGGGHGQPDHHGPGHLREHRAELHR